MLSLVRLSIALIRLIILLLTRRWGLIVVGCGCIIAGLIVGILSHEVTYQRSGNAHIAHFLSTETGKVGYLQLDNGSTLFTVEQDAFTPAIGGTQTFHDGDSISIVYRTDTTTSIDETSDIGTHLAGDAYPVIEIHDFSTNVEYTTDEYNQNPVDYYQNNWSIGGGLLTLGAIVAGLAIFVPMILAKNGKHIDININPGTFMARRRPSPLPGTPVNQPVTVSQLARQMVHEQSLPTALYQPIQPIQPQQPPSYPAPYQPVSPATPVPQQAPSPYQQYPTYQPVSEYGNPYSQPNNPYTPYQQPQE